MKTALLITDLEGVAGVDDVDALSAGSLAYTRARARLEAEVAAAVEGLVSAGFDRVVVSDSHRAGGGEPNLRAASLPASAVLDFRRDAYDEALFENLSAVACLGMHAAAGTAGFAAHTVEVTAAWTAGGRLLSETDLVLGLAAERGIPVVFVAGDEMLGTDAPFVPVKRSESPGRSISRPSATDLLRRAAASSPSATRKLPDDLALTFKSGWQADYAERLGGKRSGSRTVRVAGATFRERYRCALDLVYASGPVLGQALRVFDPRALREDIRGLLLRPYASWQPTPDLEDNAATSLDAFLAASAGSVSWMRADRALTLHMLEAHAPGFFGRRKLGPILDEALAALAAVPRDFPPGLFPPEAMARLDAIYVLRERRLTASLDEPALSRYIEAIAGDHPLFAWLLGEQAAQIGGRQPLRVASRPFRTRARLVDLYWLTHLLLLDTRYLRRPLPGARWATEIEELFLAVPWLLGERHLDIAAEVAFCLEAAGETATPAVRDLLALLASHQKPGAGVVDLAATADEDSDRVAAHLNAAAAIAFAGATSPS